MKRRLAIFASGAGSNFEAIARACADGTLPAEAVLMVCDRPGAAVIERAERLGVPSFVFSPKTYESKAAYEQEIVSRLREAGVDFICLAGYMRILSDVLLDAYGGRIVNIHPSLLPAFRGRMPSNRRLPTA
jgi:phosphoribosylglycinamide formyltransferase-1